METFGRSVAHEEASKGIRANIVCPGLIVTPIFDKVRVLKD